MTRFIPQSSIRLLQWAGYLLFLGYWLVIVGNSYALIKLPVMLVNLILATIVSTVWLWSRRHAQLPRLGVESAFLIFGTTQLITTITSKDPRQSLENIAVLLAFVILFWALVDWLGQGWSEEHVIGGLFFAAGVVCFAGAWEVIAWYIPWVQQGIWQPPVAYRLQSLLSHPNITAQFLDQIVLLAVALLFRTTTRFARLGLGALLIVCSAIIIFTSSRGGWLALGAGLGVMLWLRFFSDSNFSSTYIQKAYLQIRKIEVWRLLLICIGILILSLFIIYLMYAQMTSSSKISIENARSAYWPGAFKLFITNWFVGVGPGMFTRYWALVSSLPPQPVVVHAHNLYLLIAVEGGVVGLLGLVVFGFLYTIALRKRWLDFPERRWIVAVGASSFTSVVVHSAFDFLLNSFVLSFIIITISALALKPVPKESPSGWRISSLALPSLLAIMFGIYSIWGYEPFARGIANAFNNKWMEAANAMCSAAQRDPWFGLYPQQCGLAYAHAAETDPASLPRAIQSLERATTLDPNWPTNYLNLAMLYHANGQTERARQTLQIATQHAPDSGLFALNLGWVEEQSDFTNEAQSSYTSALNLGVDPHALFWEQTDLRQRTRNNWRAKQPTLAIVPTTPQEQVTYYQKILQTSTTYPDPYIGLARAYWALGDNARGDAYMRQANSVPVFQPQYRLETIWLNAEYEFRRGNIEGARRAGLEYFTQFYDYSFQGVGTWGYANYAWFGYRREGLPSDFVPQIIRADITPEIDQRIVQLAQWYIDDSKQDIACIILNRWQRESLKSQSAEMFKSSCK